MSSNDEMDDLVKRHDDELGAMAELEDCVINAIVEAEQKHGHLAEMRSKLNADHASALKRLRCDVALANQVRINIQRNAEINKSRIDTLNQLDAKIKAKRAKLEGVYIGARKKAKLKELAQLDLELQQLRANVEAAETKATRIQTENNAKIEAAKREVAALQKRLRDVKNEQMVERFESLMGEADLSDEDV